MMTRFYYCCDFFYTAMRVWLTLQLLEVMSEPKREKKTEDIWKGAMILGIAVTNTSNHIYTGSMFSNNMLFLGVLCIFALSHILYRYRNEDGFAVIFSVWYGLTMIDFFIQTISFEVLHGIGGKADALLTTGIFRGVYLIICSLLAIWFGGKIRRWLSMRKGISQKNKRWIYLATVPFWMVLVYFQKIYIRKVPENFLSHWWNFILFVLLLLLIGGMYEIKRREDQKVNLQQQKVELLEKNYQTLLEAYEKKSVLLHDIRNQLRMIREFVVSGQLQELLEYLSDTEGMWQKYVNQDFANHNLLNLILGTKKEEAEKAGITVRYEMSDMNGLKLNQTEVCALFLNLLDNAIEANQKVDLSQGRWMSLSCKRRQQMLIIRISNPTVDRQRIVTADSILETTKEDKRLHGFGTRSIKQVIKAYDGYMRVEIGNNVFTFSAFLTGFEDR